MLGPFKNFSNDNEEYYLLDVELSEYTRKTYIIEHSDTGNDWVAQEVNGANSFKYPIADGSVSAEEAGEIYSNHLKKLWKEDLDSIDNRI